MMMRESPDAQALFGKPQVRLLDARRLDLDPPALRDWARSLAGPIGARYVTRSYRYPFALVGWHHEPIGVDIEKIGPCDDAFADLICTSAERGAPALSADRDTYLTSLWSSKEALSKALGDALSYEPSRLASPMGWSTRRAGRWQSRQLMAPPGHVAWLCWRSADSAVALAPAMPRTSAPASAPAMMG
jgi:hypothetical protein